MLSSTQGCWVPSVALRARRLKEFAPLPKQQRQLPWRAEADGDFCPLLLTATSSCRLLAKPQPGWGWGPGGALPAPLVPSRSGLAKANRRRAAEGRVRRRAARGAGNTEPADAAPSAAFPWLRSPRRGQIWGLSLL